MIPESTMLIVGDDDGAAVPVLAFLHRLDELGSVAITLDEVGVSWVLRVRGERLDEGHVWERVCL
ncbi:MAG: hypothetical protein KGJ86_02645 [Chloroflexota bacterium]|nr:hypothetical protein [Chloroflexota bacterium]